MPPQSDTDASNQPPAADEPDGVRVWLDEELPPATHPEASPPAATDKAARRAAKKADRLASLAPWARRVPYPLLDIVFFAMLAGGLVLCVLGMPFVGALLAGAAGVFMVFACRPFFARLLRVPPGAPARKIMILLVGPTLILVLFLGLGALFIQAGASFKPLLGLGWLFVLFGSGFGAGCFAFVGVAVHAGRQNKPPRS